MRRRSKAATDALRKACLKLVERDPDITVQDLVLRFGVVKSTIQNWLKKSARKFS